MPQGGSTTITVTLNDQGALPRPIAGKVISLTKVARASTIVAASSGSATTNGSGSGHLHRVRRQAETVTYTATDTTDGVPSSEQSVSVTFGSLAVSTSQSTVTTHDADRVHDASGVPQPTGTIDVTLLDGTSPVGGKTVTLSSRRRPR